MADHNLNVDIGGSLFAHGIDRGYALHRKLPPRPLWLELRRWVMDSAEPYYVSQEIEYNSHNGLGYYVYVWAMNFGDAKIKFELLDSNGVRVVGVHLIDVLRLHPSEVGS